MQGHLVMMTDGSFKARAAVSASSVSFKFKGFTMKILVFLIPTDSQIIGILASIAASPMSVKPVPGFS
jgi:hypothetical protein